MAVCLLVNKLGDVLQPLHVQALVLVERHALDESSHVLVHSEALEVLHDAGLNALVERVELRPRVE